MFARVLTFAITSLVLTACKNCDYLGWHPTITSPSGKKLCAAHHLPLVTQHGFRKDSYGIVLVHYHGKSYIADYCNPNHLAPTESLQRRHGYTTPALITYCTSCEEAFEKHWASPEREQPASKIEQWRAGVKLTDG